MTTAGAAPAVTPGPDFRRLFESVPVALLVLDPELTIVAVSDAYLAATATTRGLMIGRPLFDVLPDDPGEADATGAGNLRASLRRVREQRCVDVMAIQKYPIPRRDGPGFENRYWAPVNAPVLDPDGNVAWMVHRVDDVTTYVQEQVGEVSQPELIARLTAEAQSQSLTLARQRLREQNHTLWAVLDSLDTAVIGCDREGRAVLTNRGARELFRLPPDAGPVDRWARQFSHLTFTDLHGSAIAPEDLPTELLLRGRPVRNLVIVAKADGVAARTLRVHGRVVPGGGRLAAVVAVHDVTRERRAEQLKECERLVAELLSRPEPADDVLTDVVELIGGMLGWAAAEFWSVDHVGTVLRRKAYWTSAGRRRPPVLPDLLGRGASLPGRAWEVCEPIWATDLTPEWRPVRAALAVPIPSGQTVLGVLMCYSDDHEIPDDMRTAVITGITAHIGEFLERRRAQQYAAELEATRDEYIALVGHELRTPLTSIQANADLLRSDPDLSAEDREQMLEVIHRRADDLHALIAKLLDVAGTRSGHITLHSRRMNLAAVAEAAVRHAATYHPPAIVDLNSPAEVMIDGDPDRLRHVLDELLRNALTWASEDSVVGLTLHADDHTAVLTVTNTGARIPAEEHARIFELFYRTSATTHQGLPGSGLGLTLARAIVEQHGGTITVSEPEEATTTFTVTLPAQGPAGTR